MIVQAQTEVDLELALAVDTSGSVDAYRFRLQQQGYAAAFRHPDVLKAIRSGATQSIAVIMYQWTGPFLQIVSVPWHRIHDQTSAEAFAAAIAETPRQLFGGGTSISGAIDYGVTLFPNSGYGSARRVIDISGDGINNRGRAVTQARDEAVRAGITINGLPILALQPSLDQYFQDNVIGGPGAFMIPAADFETFGEAIRRKLILEIASMRGLQLLRWRGMALLQRRAALSQPFSASLIPCARSRAEGYALLDEGACADDGR
jgi:hypothetical protein